jgi:hypothetical protein
MRKDMEPEKLHQMIKEEVKKLNDIIKPKDNTEKVGMILDAIVNIVALYLPDEPITRS